MFVFLPYIGVFSHFALSVIYFAIILNLPIISSRLIDDFAIKGTAGYPTDYMVVLGFILTALALSVFTILIWRYKKPQLLKILYALNIILFMMMIDNFFIYSSSSLTITNTIIISISFTYVFLNFWAVYRVEKSVKLQTNPTANPQPH